MNKYSYIKKCVQNNIFYRNLNTYIHFYTHFEEIVDMYLFQETI